MKTPLQTRQHRTVIYSTALSVRQLSGILLTTVGVLLAFTSVYAIRRAPFVSWIPDQRITSPPGSPPTFATQYFRLIDFDAPNGVMINKNSSNSSVLPATNVKVAACDPIIDTGCTGRNDNPSTGYKVFFNSAALNPGATTITLTVTGKNGGATAYTSFTLRWATSGSYPPTTEALPNRALRLNSSVNGTVTYSTMFVIGDVADDGMGGTIEDVDSIDVGNFTVTSSNTQLLPNSPNNISLVRMPLQEGYIDQATPRQYSLTATTAPGMSGFTTVTVEFHDPDMNYTSTSFVLQAIDYNNTEPSISNASGQKTYVACPIPTPAPSALPFTYTVASGGDSTLPSDLRVTAGSSNTALVPNDFVNNLIVTQPDSNGTGTVKIVPITPLPSLSPGVPQASTITLNVTDDKYSRQTTFLYVAAGRAKRLRKHVQPRNGSVSPGPGSGNGSSPKRRISDRGNAPHQLESD